MPDTEISRLEEIPSNLVERLDVLAIVDTSASETKKVSSVDLVQRGVELLPDGSIDPDHVDWTGVDPGVIDGASITDRTLPAVKLIADSLTAAEIAPNAIGSSELAENSVGSSELADAACDTASIQDAAVTEAKLAPALNGDNILAAGSVDVALAENSVGSTELADGAVDTAAIQNLAVTDAKIATGIDGAKISAGTVGDNQVGNGIDGGKLGNNTVTDLQLAAGINGAKLTDGSVSALALDPTGFGGGIELGDNGLIQHTNAIDPGERNGITFDAQGHITATAALLPSDLPIATEADVGGISVPPESGLFVTEAGVIGQQNSIDAATVSGITFNTHGFITDAVPLVGADLPLATSTTVGGVVVPTTNNNPLTVDGAGNLTHTASGVVPGTYASVDVNSYGLVSAGQTLLSPEQVPGIDAEKITTGQFESNRIADNAVTLPKLADYSISFIQEVAPPITADLHIGCLWYQESSAQLRMWNGNSFMPVGFGRLSQENLRFGGTVDASTGFVVNLTDAGRTAGLVVGNPLPVATNALGGLYLVVSEPGSNISVVPATTFDSGDWCLCVNEVEGWIRIDTLNAGGGGSLIRLNDLIDVDITNPGAGDTIIYDPTSGQWINQSTTADRLTITPAFDGTKTAFTLSKTVVNQNNVLVSIGGVVMEPGVDFVITSGSNQINFITAPPKDSTYFIINNRGINTASGGGGGTDLPPGSSENEYLQWNNALGSWVPSTELDGGAY